MTHTSGRSAARASRSLRTAQNVSSGFGIAPSPRSSVTRSTIAARSRPIRKERRDLAARHLDAVALQDARRLAHDLRDRPERDALAVREAAPMDDGGGCPAPAMNSSTSRVFPIPAWPMIVTSWRALVLDGPGERVVEQRPLPEAADERANPDGGRSPRRRPGPRAGGRPGRGPPSPSRSRAPPARPAPRHARVGRWTRRAARRRAPRQPAVARRCSSQSPTRGA